MGSSPLEGLESRQHIGSVKEPDVLRLRPREAAHGPREMHEMRLMGGAERMHTDFLGQQVPLAGVAARAGGEDVGPGVRAAAGQRHEMIAGQTLTLPQLLLRAAPYAIPTANLRQVLRLRMRNSGRSASASTTVQAE